MADTRETLEHDLDRLGAAGLSPAPAPPPPFLTAVGRRRTQRRVRQAGVVLAAAALLVAGAVITRSPALTRPVSPRPDLARSGDVQHITGTIGSLAAAIERDRPASRGAASRVAPVPVVRAADWRSEAKLASLVGAS